MKKGIRITLVIYGLFLLADLIVTLLYGNKVQYLEANPLYKFGGLFLPVLVNLALMGLFYWYYNKTNNITSRYVMLQILTAVTLIRGVLTLFTFINYLTNPITLAQAQTIAEANKDLAINPEIWRVLISNLIPYLSGAAAFFFFSFDHTIKKKVSPVPPSKKNGKDKMPKV